MPALLDDEGVEAVREQVDQIAEPLTLLALFLLYIHRGDG
jgi:hypothetical protein